MNKDITYMNNNSLKRFKVYCKNYYTAKSSADNRISTAKKLIKFLNEREKSINSVKHNSIEEFFDTEIEKGTSLVTINNYHSYLKGFFTFLKEQNDNKVMEYDKVKIERIRKMEYEVFSDSEISELFDIIDLEKNMRIKISNMILFKIMFYTGCTLSEVHSLKVYKKTSDVTDDDNYIVLETKEIYFRHPNVRKFKLYDSLCNDIINYHRIIADAIGKDDIPTGGNLFLTTYGKTKTLKMLQYNSLQYRINSIKKKSSFSNKKLSLKNIRHTLIKKLINSGKSLEFISSSIGIDISTLKFYLDNIEETESEIIDYFYGEHPYKTVIN
ncbi:site-specific integrase [Sporosalibacterium faouarense]|uniref:site-specific integrase n=1 Tax=Sporosalibacterium faouarense TaxID=516123 RepID=UPI00192A70CC|nr:site-specific integrase [Sporosalibacterium faouarense]